MNPFRAILLLLILLGLVFPAMVMADEEPSHEDVSAGELDGSDVSQDSDAVQDSNASSVDDEPVAETSPPDGEAVVAVADTDSQVEVVMGGLPKPAPKPAPKPRKMAAAMTTLAVETDIPFQVGFRLYSKTVKKKSSAFQKSKSRDEHLRYEIEVRLPMTTKTFAVCQDAPMYGTPTLLAQSFSQEGRHVWQVSIVTKASISKHADVSWRQDCFFLYEESSANVELQFTSVTMPQRRHNLKRDGVFNVHRELDGSLDWAGRPFMTLSDRIEYHSGKRSTVEYRASTWRWNHSRQAFVFESTTLQYEIQKGDLLVNIGKFYFDSPMAWQKIMKNNPKVNPKNLKIGSRITIPEK